MIDYGSSKWKRKRKKILRLDGYKDRVMMRYGQTIAADHVHHIYPAREYPEYSFCDWNLISVSKKTHERLEYRKTGELTKMGKALQKRTKPGVDWRKGNPMSTRPE